jgi:hypothetical protein
MFLNREQDVWPTISDPFLDTSVWRWFKKECYLGFGGADSFDIYQVFRYHQMWGCFPVGSSSAGGQSLFLKTHVSFMATWDFSRRIGAATWRL